MHNEEQDLIHKIRRLLEDEVLIHADSPETDLLKTGVMDSLTLVQLLLRLEEHFGMRVPMEELDINDFRSVRSIARWVTARTHVTAAVAARR